MIHLAVIFSFVIFKAKAQISPGELSKAHAELEGILNCTQCHVLGGKASNNKCLACHDEIESLTTQNRGYHASTEVNNQQCTSCHSDHHGRNFDMARLEEDNFRHRLTGYELTGQHQKIDCRECHKPDLIADNSLKNNESTYLGLETKCLSCHTDYHQKTLTNDCIDCHNTMEFSPAANFDHSKTEFALRGKHSDVDCIDCHQKETRNGQEFQRFSGIKFAECINCHEDPHENKFGTNCTDCHKEESFNVTGSMAYFDHTKTGFELHGKHLGVDCRQCHTSRFTDPLPHNTCAACHRDFHRSQFTERGITPDCAECHTVNGFEVTLYTIEDHNKSNFPLEEAHLATPCFSCHKPDNKWTFKAVGERCVDCHEDVHAGYIDEKYYPDQSCVSCHLVTNWEENIFNHDLTEFKLSGVHAVQTCMDCHGNESQHTANKFENFQNLTSTCSSCHSDNHNQQFEKAGTTDCASCHGFADWEMDRFDHSKTAFRLDGKHAQVDCSSCHKEVASADKVFVQYKFKSFECVDCHQ